MEGSGKDSFTSINCCLPDLFQDKENYRRKKGRVSTLPDLFLGKAPLAHPHMAVLEGNIPPDQNPVVALAMGAFTHYKGNYRWPDRRPSSGKPFSGVNSPWPYLMLWSCGPPGPIAT